MFVDSGTYPELLNIMMAGDESPTSGFPRAIFFRPWSTKDSSSPSGLFWTRNRNGKTSTKKTSSQTPLTESSIWGVPYQIPLNCVGFYNASIFNECGIDHWPAKIQELTEDCKKIKAAGYTPIALGNKDQWPAASTLLSNFLYKNTDREWVTSLMENTGASFTDPDKGTRTRVPGTFKIPLKICDSH